MIIKVRHVSKLMRNLILVGQLDSDGHIMTFGSISWKVTKRDMVKARGQNSGMLYITSRYRDVVDVIDNTENIELWHCRLGHMSENGMKMLVKDGMISELK